MKDVLRLMKERGLYYLCTLLITLGITVLLMLLFLKVNTGTVTEKLDAGFRTEAQLMVELENASFANYMKEGIGAHIIREDVCGLMFFYSPLIAVTLGTMCFSAFGYMRRETRLFMESLPVKKWALHLYDYVALLGIQIANILVAGGILLVGVGSVNGRILALAEQYPGVLSAVVPATLMGDVIGTLLKEFSIVAFWFILFGTFIYFISMLCKNKIAGIAIAFLFGLMGSYLISEIFYTYEPLNWDIVLALTLQNTEDTFGIRPVRTIAVYIALTLLLQAIMFLVASRMECSKGRLFCFRFLDLLFPVLLGLFAFGVKVYLAGVFTPGDLMGAFLLMLVVTGSGYAILYAKPHRIHSLEVKEIKRWKNPELQGKIVMASLWMTVMTVAGVMACDSRLSLPFDLVIDSMNHWNYSLENPLTAQVYVNEILRCVFEDSRVLYGAVGTIVALYWIYKGIQAFFSLNRGRREFLLTLPRKKSTEFLTNLCLDVLIGVVPMVVSYVWTLIRIGTLIMGGLWEDKSPVTAFLAELNQELITDMLFGIVLVLVMNAVITFVCTVVADDKLCVAGTILVIVSFYTTVFAIDRDVLSEFDFIFAFFYGNVPKNIVLACIADGAFVIAAMVISFILYIRRDESKRFFYYSFARYGFACGLCIIYSGLVLIGGPGWMKYAFAVAGTVLIWYLTMHFTSTDRAIKRRKNAV